MNEQNFEEINSQEVIGGLNGAGEKVERKAEVGQSVLSSMATLQLLRTFRVASTSAPRTSVRSM